MAKFYVITLARVSSNGDCSIVRFGGRLGSRLRGTAVEQLGANSLCRSRRARSATDAALLRELARDKSASVVDLSPRAKVSLWRPKRA